MLAGMPYPHTVRNNCVHVHPHCVCAHVFCVVCVYVWMDGCVLVCILKPHDSVCVPSGITGECTRDRQNWPMPKTRSQIMTNKRSTSVTFTAEHHLQSEEVTNDMSGHSSTSLQPHYMYNDVWCTWQCSLVPSPILTFEMKSESK